jgi:hypothetical protein
LINQYFCHQNTWQWMDCRIGENIPFHFVHIITISMLPTFWSVAVQRKYLWLLYQRDIHHRILHICTKFLQLYIPGKSTLAIFLFVKELNKVLNKSRNTLVRNHSATDQILELLLSSILLLRHGYFVLKNIKSIRELLKFQGNKWNRSSCLISKEGHNSLWKDRFYLW